MAILVLNAGSSSLKAAVFDGNRRLADGRVERIGTAQGAAARLKFGDEEAELSGPTDHAAALRHLLDRIDVPITAVGHRIVHGGTLFHEPVRLDAAVRAQLEALSPLAPLHNPVALTVVDAAARVLPDAPQIGCFDTAFHATQPELATRFALPTGPETAGLRRYGFHGLSYQGLVRSLGTPPPARLLACHLGAGASLCAIRDGASVATTMGYSPLDGLVMGTRCGSIDPAAVLELARRVGIDAAEDLLNRKSGLIGLSGESPDLRTLAASTRPEAAAAIDQFVYWIVRHAGSMIAALGGLDAIAFTGGIGENAADIRARACAGLAWTGLRIADNAMPGPDGRFEADGSTVAAWVVACDEEATIAATVSAFGA